jgi:23S rRNA pseudouridine2605 synthase
VILEGTKTLPAHVKVLRKDKEKTWLEILLIEGKNRQIRRIAAKFGLKVLHLHRTHLGNLDLQSSTGQPLLSGQYRWLNSSEIKTLKQGTNSFTLKAVVSE